MKQSINFHISFPQFLSCVSQTLSCSLQRQQQCDNVQCQHVVSHPLHYSRGRGEPQSSGVFPNLSQETCSSFGEQGFDADSSLWRMSSLITSEIHLNPPASVPQTCHLYGLPVFVSQSCLRLLGVSTVD